MGDLGQPPADMGSGMAKLNILRLLRWTISAAAPAAVWFGGCQSYHPKPLSNAAVEQALRTPEAGVLQVRAAELRHPILRPIRLDPTKALSPDEAAVLAVLLNPSLRAARDQRALANAQLLQAGLLPNPELTYSFEVPNGGDTTGTVDAFGIELSWEATSLITHKTKQNMAETRQAAVDMDVAWQEWQVAQAAKAVVYQLVSLQRQAALAEQAEQQMDRNVALVRKAVRRGVLMPKELAAPETARKGPGGAPIQLSQEAGQQRLQLNRLLGLVAATRVELKPDIQLPSRFNPPTSQVLLKDLERRRLDLIALRHGYDSQEAAVRAAILNQFPKVSIGPTVGRDVENVNTVGFALSISLPIFDRNQGAIAVEKATRRKLFDEYVNRIFETRSDIEMILMRIRYLNRQIAAAAQAQTDLQKLVDEYRKALDGGRVDALTFYAAWNDSSDSRMKLLALKGQLAQAVVALELAAGMYEIPQGPQSPATTSLQSKEVNR
jgi:outer membrane protein, heavy metal efflux system